MSNIPGLKPIKFTKVTKQYIKDRISELKLSEENNKYLYDKIIDILHEKRLNLKDMHAINIEYLDRAKIINAQFYAKDSYFTRDLWNYYRY